MTVQVFLETDRLVLRRFTWDDVDNLLVLDSDPDVLRFTNPGGTCAAREVYETKILPRFLAYYERDADYGYWVALEKPANTFLGWFHFRPARDNPDEIELGYRLLPQGRGKGYATEGSRALLHKGFTKLGVARVVATALAENVASRRVMEKSGLTLVEHFVHRITDLATGQVTEHPAVKYALDKDEFFQRNDDSESHPSTS